jgi:hypothetical protein
MEQLLNQQTLAALRGRLVSLTKYSSSGDLDCPSFFQELHDCIQQIDDLIPVIDSALEAAGPAPISTSSSLSDAIPTDASVDSLWRLKWASPVHRARAASRKMSVETIGPETDKSSLPDSPLSHSFTHLSCRDKGSSASTASLGIPSSTSSLQNLNRTLASYRMSQSSVVGRSPTSVPLRMRSPQTPDPSDDDLYSAVPLRQPVPHMLLPASRPLSARKRFSSAFREAVSSNPEMAEGKSVSSQEAFPESRDP